MNVKFPNVPLPHAGRQALTQGGDVATRDTDDVAVTAFIQAKLDTATSEKDAALAALKVALAQASREWVHCGGTERLAEGEIKALADTITALEGLIAAYDNAILGLA